MVWRLVSLVITLGVVAWLLHSFLSSDGKVDQAISNNPAVQEQKKALKDAGIDADNKKELNKALNDSVKQLEEYEKQVDDLPKSEPP